MTRDTEVAIIGAGPYGLSLAAHLGARGVKYRIFGDSMRFWRDMPVGVNLKSLAFATNIYVPQRGFSFPEWCRKQGLEDFEPCTMQSFAAYGMEMQARFVPDVDNLFVKRVAKQGNLFDITLASEEQFSAEKVVVCTGLSGLSHIPSELKNLGPDRMRHTFDISDYGEFRGKTVAVIGAGASAIEAGALVREAGGSSEVFVRGPNAVFHDRSARDRPLWERIKNPMSVLGASRKSWVLQKLPLLVYHLPLERRTRLVKSYQGPSSPWWIKDRVQGVVPIRVRHELIESGTTGDRVQLRFRTGEGHLKDVEVDFVISGTGYDADIARLTFLDTEIKRDVRRIERAPDLNVHFESSVRGLHFLGPLSFMCFGPIFRFVCGSMFTAPRLAGHLAQRPRHAKRAAAGAADVSTRDGDLKPVAQRR